MMNTVQPQKLETAYKDNNMSITAIVVLTLAGVAIISASIGLVLEYLASKVIRPDNLLPPEQPSENIAQGAEVIDAEFTDEREDDFEYPYEDIGKVVGEEQ